MTHEKIFQLQVICISKFFRCQYLLFHCRLYSHIFFSCAIWNQGRRFNLTRKLPCMKKTLLQLFILALTHTVVAQENKANNQISISTPLIWNHSNGVYYTLGNRREPDGKAISYGINSRYSRIISHGIFATAGVGYFRQNFNIQRPFDYVTPDGSEPLIRTESYSYSNFNMLAGVGYQKKLSKEVIVKGEVIFNQYYAFREKYRQSYSPGVNEIYKKSFFTGQSVFLALGMSKFISHRFSVGAEWLQPVHTRWKDDDIFFEYDYSTDSQIIAKNKFSTGISLSFYYHF